MSILILLAVIQPLVAIPWWAWGYAWVRAAVMTLGMIAEMIK